MIWHRYLWRKHIFTVFILLYLGWILSGSSIHKCFSNFTERSSGRGISSIIPVILLHANLTNYSLLSIWQARQLNSQVHVLYSLRGTLERICNSNSSTSRECIESRTNDFIKLINSLKSEGVYFVDLESKYLTIGVESFKDAFHQGNDKALFDRYHREKWQYEEWCAMRWLYVYNYAIEQNFEFVYVQDSDILLYANVSVEFDYLRPADIAISTSCGAIGASSHNVFLRVVTLRRLLNFMTDTWLRRNDLAGYVRTHWVTDMFYFTHFFVRLNGPISPRARGVIVKPLNDVYYADKSSRSSGRVFDESIGRNSSGMYNFRKHTVSGEVFEYLKNVTWITDDSKVYLEPDLSHSNLPRYPVIFHNRLEENVRLMNLHFHGHRKRYLASYLQRYISHSVIDRILHSLRLPHRTLM